MHSCHIVTGQHRARRATVVAQVLEKKGARFQEASDVWGLRHIQPQTVREARPRFVSGALDARTARGKPMDNMKRCHDDLSLGRNHKCTCASPVAAFLLRPPRRPRRTRIRQGSRVLWFPALCVPSTTPLLVTRRRAHARAAVGLCRTTACHAQPSTGAVVRDGTAQSRWLAGGRSRGGV